MLFFFIIRIDGGVRLMNKGVRLSYCFLEFSSEKVKGGFMLKEDIWNGFLFLFRSFFFIVFGF